MAKISKTQIEKKLERKTNPGLRELIRSLKKQGKLEIANLLAASKRKRIIVNIDRLSRETKQGDKIIVPGKVLGKGSIQHNIIIAAFSFSQEAIKKLKSSKLEEISLLINDKDTKIIS
ncbi:50S ribosomal protein L18e [Candidatus Pacearchaeota archaeon]|nr:50S ribosomal protein L18e [Candidatus Pacearchaeota archaeon]